MYKFSIVVPVLNESPCLEKLVEEIKSVMESEEASWELIFVDDGSTDDTLESH